MSLNHSATVFKNSCLKLPINPINKFPSPSYEHPPDITLTNSLSSNRSDNRDSKQRNDLQLKLSENKHLKKSTGKCSNQSFSAFLNSIPDYREINHLSNKEFYEQLNTLKLKQKELYSNCEQNASESECCTWLDAYKPHTNSKRSDKKLTSDSCIWYSGNQKTKENSSISDCDVSTPSITSEKNFLSSSLNRSTSSAKRRTVRINNDKANTPDTISSVDCASGKLGNSLIRNKNFKSTNLTRNKASEKNSPSKSKKDAVVEKMWLDYFSGNDSLQKVDLLSDSEFDLPPENFKSQESLRVRSMPSSPLKTKHSVVWKDNGITIPKPFKMTVRDEEEQIVNSLLASAEDEDKPKNVESKMFRANPVPIESRVPLFDKIMADQERRREIVKLNSKIALQSQVRPFSFTRKEEEMKEISRLIHSSSSPQLGACSKDHSPKKRTFKAKPIPKNIFSNYFYEKMREDEYYRALKKRIRAEEMLKASSLPPSMAAREKEYKKALELLLDTQYLEDLKSTDSGSNCRNKFHQIPDFHAYHNRMQNQLEKIKNNFITTSTHPYQLRTAKRAEKKKIHNSMCTRSHEGSENPRPTSAFELQSINRSNLAAILRIESAKKRLEVEMQRHLEEARRKNEIRWRAKLTRQRSAWQTLKYDHEEELALRLQLRREEERLRNEEYRHQMELMHGRVRQLPYLFEGHQFPKSEHCRKKIVQEVFAKMQDDALKTQKVISDLETLHQENTERLSQIGSESNKEDSSEEIKEVDTNEIN